MHSVTMEIESTLEEKEHYIANGVLKKEIYREKSGFELVSFERPINLGISRLLYTALLYLSHV